MNINKVKKKRRDRTRKPDSGHKHKRKPKKITITFKDLDMQMQQLERESLDTTLTTQQRDTLRKRKHSLKNRMSSLKCRVNKRSRLDQLEKTVQRLQQKLVILDRENQSLRQSQSLVDKIENNCDISTRKRNRTNTSEAENSVNEDGVYSSPSLSPSSPEKKETSKLVKPCTHNCESAVFTSRNSHLLRMTGQYSHMRWEMPWKTLRSIFSTLWIVSKTLIASRNTKNLLKATMMYQETQRSLRQIFSKTLISYPHSDMWKHCNEGFSKDTATECTMQQQAFVIFDRISQKFLMRAMSGRKCN